MANSAPHTPDWRPIWAHGLRAWACLLEHDGRWAGSTWFCVDTANDHDRLVLPRLIGKPAPGEEFCELLVELVASGADPEAVLLGPPITGPEQLRTLRVAELKERKERLRHAGPPVEVPFATVLRVIDGQRDHGGVPDVDTRILHWVGLWARHVMAGDTIEAIASAEPIDDSHARRNLSEVRRRLASHGVLPFALWPDGKLPRGWRDSQLMCEGLDRWRADATILDAKRRLITRAHNEHRRTRAALHEALAAVHNDDANQETAEAIFWAALGRQAG